MSVLLAAPMSFLLPSAPRVAWPLARSAFPAMQVAEEPAAAAPAEPKASDAEELCGILPDNVCEQIYEDADAVFAVIDENGDGSISRKELTKHLTGAGYSVAAVGKIFGKLDVDGSGELSKEELRQGFLQYTPLREAPGLGSYNQQFVDEIHEDADRVFSSIDSNNDGSVTKDELREHLKVFSGYSFKAISNVFKLLDVNRDGEISKDELREAFVKYSALRQAIGEGPNFK